MRSWWIVVALFAAAGCSFDAGGAVSRDDAGVAPPADAAPPDAGLVRCAGDDDCASPPGACQLAGRCDLGTNTCSYPDKDCSAVAEDCNLGVCDQATGDCVAQPGFEGEACGAVEICSNFGDCGGFDGGDPCDETGLRSRTCTAFTCAAGSCAATESIDTEACERDQDGVTCADTACDQFGDCGGFTTACDESGTKLRDCTAFLCQDAACQAQPFVDSVACERPSTDRDVCAPDECPAFSECGGFLGVCDETGQQSRFCTRFRCNDEACLAESFAQTRSCTRDTEGLVCGHVEDDICTGAGECPDSCTRACATTCFAVTCAGGGCPASRPGNCP